VAVSRPEQAPVGARRHGTRYAHRPPRYGIMRRTNVGMSRRRSLASTPEGRFSWGSGAAGGDARRARRGPSITSITSITEHHELTSTRRWPCGPGSRRVSTLGGETGGNHGDT